MKYSQHKPHPPVAVCPLTTKGQQLTVQTVTTTNQTTVLMTNPNTPYNFRIKETKIRIGRET